MTGSGHYLEESMALAARLPAVDLFLSAAAEEVLPLYKLRIEELKKHFRVLRDRTASGVPVGMLYEDIQLGFSGIPGRLRSSVTVTPFASHHRLYSAGSGYLSFLNSNHEFCCPETASFEARQALSLTW